MLKTIAAWAVHVFTASGLLAAFMALLAAAEKDWRMAMIWLFVCLIIDGIDGTFARMANVRVVLPQVQGKYIDYVIDFFTYAILPAYIFYETFALEGWPRGIAVSAILLSSALYYGIEDMTSPSGKHFKGFPVMWNMVVYVLVFVVPDWSPWLVFFLILLLAVAHFLPIYFAYPSRGGRWWPATLSVATLFIGSAMLIVWRYPEPQPWARITTLIATAYFAILALVDSWHIWKEDANH